MKIYVITNLVNGKQYVGQTRQPIKKRWARHLSSGNAMYAALIKYGKDNFSLEVVASANSQEELNELEVKWIEKLGTLSPGGYNLVSGGKNGYKSKETIEKLRLANLGKKASPETKAKMSASQKIAQLEPSVVEEKRKRMHGNKYTLGVPAWNKGITGQDSHSHGNHFALGKGGRKTPNWSPETRRRISESAKKRMLNPALQPMLGKKHTAEARAKISAANLRRAEPARKVSICLTDTGVIYKTIKSACLELGIGYESIRNSLDSGKPTRKHGYIFVYA